MHVQRTSLIHQAIIAQLPDLKQVDPKIKEHLTFGNLTMLLVVVGFVCLQIMGDRQPKEKLANSSWGGTAEIACATRKAKTQIPNKSRNNVSLYINLDRDLRQERDAFWKKIGWRNPVVVPKPKKKPGQPKPRSDRQISTFYLPDVQQGVLIGGSAGTGKSFSAADPLYRSAIDQGLPMVLYDFKYPEQTQRIAAYAAVRGYEVEVFAPGYEESCTCNPLEFIRDEEDSIAAAQLAKTINANMNSEGGKKDEFFENAGNAFIEGALLLTKAVPKLLVRLDPAKFGDAEGNPNDLAKSFDDLMTTQAIIALPDIANRLAQAKEARIIGAWTGIPFNQAISVKDAEKTVSGIVSTASAVFRNFIKRDFVGAFIGKSNIPQRIEGKKLVVFGLDNINRDVISPILASILHMTVRNNIYGKVKRHDPLIVGLDEVATIKLPALNNWLAEGREMGFCGILGVQHIPQLERAYGKETARVIFGNCATKIIFNPQETESAKMFAEMLGEMEITYSTTSRSTSKSKGGGSSSRSQNMQRQKKHLFEPAQIMRMKRGRCIIINPNFERGDEAYLPILKNIEIRQEEIAHKDWSVANWDTVLRNILQKRPEQLRDAPDLDEKLRQMLRDRDDLAKVLLPLATADK